jgi:hypothetical protein
MKLERLREDFQKAARASLEAGAKLNFQQRHAQALKNSRNPHQDSSKAISFTLPKLASTSKTRKASSTTRKPVAK